MVFGDSVRVSGEGVGWEVETETLTACEMYEGTWQNSKSDSILEREQERATRSKTHVTQERKT